jgi:hypothetical protein
MVLGLAGCGGSSGSSADEVGRRIERFIVSDIDRMAIKAGIGDSVRVKRIKCTKVDTTHYTCEIRSTSNYGDGDSIADVLYDPKTKRTVYDIRP